MHTLNIKGRLVTMDRPWVMGIFNATPDSFFEGHANKTADAQLKLIAKMVNDGADIIDVGGQSTRPGSTKIEVDEELQRVLPIIELIKNNFPQLPVSIDTYYAAVAKAAVEEGADMVNDISGGSMDENMLMTVGHLNVPYICMHMKGTPQTMTSHCNHENILLELMQYFNEKIIACKAARIKDVIMDLGFGFAKNSAQNFYLLKELSYFKELGLPILVGLSRKRTIWESLGITANEALNGTTVLNTIALTKGANILRVHDVKEAVEAVKLFQLMKQQDKTSK